MSDRSRRAYSHPSHARKLLFEKSGKRRKSTFEQAVASWLIVAFLMGICLSPRMPIDLAIGRAAEYRLNELLLLPMAAMALIAINRSSFSRKSPWSPLLLIAFVATSIVFLYTFWANQEIWLRVLGYGYRFFVFFVIIVVIAVLYSIAGPQRDRAIVFGVTVAFVVNSGVTISQRLNGATAIYVNDYTDAMIPMYGSGLLGEPNPLSAATFYVFILVVLGLLLKNKTLTVFTYVPFMFLCLLSLGLVANRSAMASAVAVLFATMWSCLRTWPARFAVIGPASGVLVVLASASSFYLRLDFDSLNQATIVRVDLWTQSWNKLIESPLSGWGLGVWSEPHQAYLRILGEFGVVAAALLFALFGSILFTSARRKLAPLTTSRPRNMPFLDWNWAFKVFLFGLLVSGFLTDSLTPVMAWQLLAYLGGVAWGSWAGKVKVRDVKGKAPHLRTKNWKTISATFLVRSQSTTDRLRKLLVHLLGNSWRCQ